MVLLDIMKSCSTKITHIAKLDSGDRMTVLVDQEFGELIETFPALKTSI